MINRVLIANRSEIASRIIRTCRRLGVGTVAVFSDADAYAPYVREADSAWPLAGNSPAETYLRGDLLIAAALARGCDAIHPGYGFLSENASFAQSVIDAGLTWIGPPPAAITAMGSKIEAKRLMRAAGVPVLPDSSVESLEEIGLPALVKASAGGGGRGMRIVRDAAALDEAVASGQREAAAAFGDGTVFVERFVEGGRHIEIQVFADLHGNVVSLFERDCTVQRRHQKIIEEAPSPAVAQPLREAMSAAAVSAARAVGYVGAGTVEFLVDSDSRFSFLEMNTRLQVEHPVTEMITGLDLVELQLAVAGGEPLPPAALEPTITGHAVEVRLCAEDPESGYMPSSGTFRRIDFAEIDGVRVDSGVTSGSAVSPFYDSMIAKVIAHAPTRAGAINKLQRALSTAHLIGPITNRSQLLDLLPQLAEQWQQIDTGWLDRNPLSATDAPSAFIAAAALAWARSQRTALAKLPPGWRNNPSQPQQVRVGRHEVHYRHDRDGLVTEAVVDGVAVEEGWMPALRFIETEIDGDVVFVARGQYRFAIPPRYTPPDDAGRAGSTTAPMPGSILRIAVEVGDTVVAGQPLLAMEAMKMEHQIVSPAAGTVAEVFVEAGQQVDSGQPLVRIDSS
ncbi:MAG TPA: biotin carboxylase N-terminal domain-containing protein [Ilumatobacteraceae bacterium]|nr:biotin carboxylase N-terminal domain-containing protein [Ilumatobacteraceae bacterium]